MPVARRDSGDGTCCFDSAGELRKLRKAHPAGLVHIHLLEDLLHGQALILCCLLRQTQDPPNVGAQLFLVKFVGGVSDGLRVGFRRRKGVASAWQRTLISEAV